MSSKIKQTKKTREAWLLDAHKRINEYVFPDDQQCPPCNISVGVPKNARGKGNNAIGQCWHNECSKDKKHVIFISPTIADNEDNAAVRMLDVLVHEMVHATVGIDAAHGKVFKSFATAVGLEGKMTATVAGERLTATLTKIYQNHLGKFPGRAMVFGDKGPRKGKQATRLLKAASPCCGTVARITGKYLNDDGVTFKMVCPDHGGQFTLVNRENQPCDIDGNVKEDYEAPNWSVTLIEG